MKSDMESDRVGRREGVAIDPQQMARRRDPFSLQTAEQMFCFRILLRCGSGAVKLRSLLRFELDGGTPHSSSTKYNQEMVMIFNFPRYEYLAVGPFHFQQLHPILGLRETSAAISL
jgi:hypothetical protein